MERRGFLGLVAGVLAAPAVGSAATPETYGYLTPEIVIARGYDNATVRVFFNGYEITNRGDKIVAVDDRAGYVEQLATDWTGNYYRDALNPTKLARERQYGLVRVTMRRVGDPG